MDNPDAPTAATTAGEDDGRAETVARRIAAIVGLEPQPPAAFQARGRVGRRSVAVQVVGGTVVVAAGRWRWAEVHHVRARIRWTSDGVVVITWDRGARDRLVPDCLRGAIYAAVGFGGG